MIVLKLNRIEKSEQNDKSLNTLNLPSQNETRKLQCLFHIENTETSLFP